MRRMDSTFFGLVDMGLLGSPNLISYFILFNVDRFWQLVGKLGFFTFTCLNITDAISVVSQCILLVNLPMQLFVVSCITLRILLNEDYC